MRLNFRHGLVRYQTDSRGTPAFLQFEPSHDSVSIIVHETPTLINFAHRDANYLVEETITIINAWANLPNENSWLYWDVDLQNAAVTRNHTILKPLVSQIAPQYPLIDQHWFDLNETVMKVWSGTKWVEKIRLFSGAMINGRVITNDIGSQVGLDDIVVDTGYILLDSFNLPLRTKPLGEPPSWYSRFMTSESWFTVVNRSNVLSKLDSGNFPVVASEPIPKFSLVQMMPNRRIKLARHTDHTSRVNGVILEDMYESDVADLFCHGVVSNNDWFWDDAQVNKALYSGAHGEITTSPPDSGVYQQIGYVFDRQSIFIDLMPVIVLDEINEFGYDESIQDPPIANFTVDIVEGLAPLTVRFTTLSENGVNFEWDFQNNKSWDGVGEQVTYTFEHPGRYTVTHRVSNEYGTDTKTIANLITVREPAQQILRPNLKLKFSAIGMVKPGVTFKLRLLVENAGAGAANSFVRKIIARTDTGVDVIVVNANGAIVNKTGTGTSQNPKITSVMYKEKTLNTLDRDVVELELKIDAFARNVSFSAEVDLPEDSNLGDNEAYLQLPVKI